MDTYCREICKLESHFYGLKFHHVIHDYNVAADVLSKLGSKRALIPAGVFVQALNSPTVKIEEPLTKPDLVPALGQEVLVVDPDWRAPILDFIVNNKSYPKDKEHERLVHPSCKLRRHRSRCLQALGFLRHPFQVHLPARRGFESSARSTRESTETMPGRQPWLAKPSGRASTGQQPWLMLGTL